MTDPRARRLLELLRAALAVPESERAAWVAAHCGDDPSLADELATLLADAGEERRAAIDVVATRLTGDAALVDLSGTTLGEFRLSTRLGQGGSAVVYVADHERLGRRVALKIMRRAWTLRSGEANFRHEARALARLQHDHVAVVYDYGLHAWSDPFGRTHTVPWLAVELVLDAQPISAVAAQCGLDRKLELLVQACRGLAAAHQALIEHGDVSSANVLVGRDGRVKVVDLGLARLGAADDARPARTVCGNRPYTAPELLAARDDQPIASARRDVFSFGIVMLEVLSGVPAATLRGNAETLEELARRPVPRLRSLKPELPEELEWIAAKATESDPTRRYRSADEVLDELERFRARRPVSVGDRRWTYVARKFAERHPWRIATVAALLAALVVAGSWQLDRVRAAEREQLQAGELDVLERLLSSLIGAFDPSGDTADPVRLDPHDRPELLHIRDRLMTHSIGTVERRVALLAQIGKMFRARGDFEDAEPALECACGLVVDHDGVDTPAWAERQHDLAMLAHAREQFVSAEPHYRAALRVYESSSGPAAERTRHMRDDLAEFLMASPSRWAEAEQLLQRNVELAPLDDSYARARAHQRLGYFYLESTRHADAAVEIDEGTTPELAPDVPAARRADALHLRAKLAIALRDFDTARALLDECVTLRRSLGPRTRMRTADAMLTASQILSLEDRTEERVRMLDEIHGMYAEVLDEEHPLMLIALANVAEATAAAGRVQAAGDVLERVLAAIDRKYGPNSRRAMRERVSSAQWLMREGAVDEAECYLLQAVEIHTTAGLPLDVHLALGLETLSRARWQRRDPEGALYWTQRAAIVCQLIRPTAENLRVGVLSNLCQFALEAGRRGLGLASACVLERDAWSDPEWRCIAAEHAARWRQQALRRAE